MEKALEFKVVAPEGYEIDKENSTFECIKFRKHCPFLESKIYVSNSTESERVQVALLELGCKWASGGEKVMHTDRHFLYVSEYARISYGDSYEFFRNDEYKDVLAEEIINY